MPTAAMSTRLSNGWSARTRKVTPGLCQTRLQPLLLNLHGDPRWQPFLKKIGLADQVERRP